MSTTPVYDQRYSGDYREHLSGYEIARWEALHHFTAQILKLSSAKKVLDYGAGSGLHVNLWEKNRLLKPGGYFIWTTPCANWFSIEHVFSGITGKIEKRKVFQISIFVSAHISSLLSAHIFPYAVPNI